MEMVHENECEIATIINHIPFRKPRIFQRSLEDYTLRIQFLLTGIFFVRIERSLNAANLAFFALL